MGKFEIELEMANELIQKAEGNWAIIQAVKHIIKALQLLEESKK